MKLKGQHVETTEEIEAESQAMQNTTSWMHLQKWQKCWEWCIRMEGDYFESGGG
jgi:hypothetical protein